jgi:adenylate kinase
MAAKPDRPDRAAWLHGGEAHCNVAPAAPLYPRRLGLLGAPGVGKNTQARLLSSRLGVCHLATGELFRAAGKISECDRTPTMTIALEHLRAGALVPDEIIQNLIVERSRCLRCKGGFVLEDFPRSAAQAEALDKLLTAQDVRLDSMLHYELSVETLIARLNGRRHCPACQAVFHVATRPPRRAEYCDFCGTGLVQREADRLADARVRVLAGQLSIVPLVDFYRMKGILISINAAGTAEEVFERTLAALQNHQC